MRGPISDVTQGAAGDRGRQAAGDPGRPRAGDPGRCAVSAAYRTSGPVPALYHEDPLFLELCASFDELIGPVVAALDCFPAYLDPWLAPHDFLAWLGTLIGVDAVGTGQPGQQRGQEQRQRAQVAGAVRAYQARGTAEGLRAVVAAVTGLPPERITISEGGAVAWSDVPGTRLTAPFDPAVKITLVVPPGWDPAALAASARTAAEPALPVFSQLRIEVVES